MSSSTSHQGWTTGFGDGSAAVSNPKTAKYVGCSVILHTLGGVGFACVMSCQEDPLKMWSFMHERYSAKTTFKKVSVHSTLASFKYTGHLMQEYGAKWELCSVQLDFVDAPVDEGLLLTMLVETFGDRVKFPYGAVLSAILTKDLSCQQPATRLWQEENW